MTGIRCHHCAKAGVRRQGTAWFCATHYRFVTMRASASRHGHYVPTRDELENAVPADMRCALCGCDMVWLSRSPDGETVAPKTVITLRWFGSRHFKFVCRSCSTKATFAPDQYLDHDPLKEKFCPRCRQWKLLSGFWADRKTAHRGFCIDCEKARHAKWEKTNRQKRTEYHRALKAKKAISGEAAVS